MKSEPKQCVRNPDMSTSVISRRPVDRRRFLKSVAGVGAVAGLGGSAFGQALNRIGSSATPNGNSAPKDARLPDGTEYVSWERPLTFSKTYYVDNSSASADDKGPGTKARPF